MTYSAVFVSIFQNADDNIYPSEGGVIPALAFVVERDCITVLNNETGFQEKNIRAICDVGRSTKGKHKYGYIGKYLSQGSSRSEVSWLCVVRKCDFVWTWPVNAPPLLTGQKGIGFKSVFKVTDCPEIHSNGFHLRFDKTCGPMGYILPHWAEDERHLDSQLTDVNPHRLDKW